MRARKKRWKKILLILLCAAVVGTGAVLGLNSYVKRTAGRQILTETEAAALEGMDCILVLGCGVRQDGSPTHMLEDRLKQAEALYKLGAAPKLLMSGDHSRTDYNEVGAMKAHAEEAGIPGEDVFMDHAGFSTYESLYRAKEIFGAEKVIIVTQEYHLYRALYIAQRMGLEAWGVSSDYRTYVGQPVREAREILARLKDVATTVFWPDPTYLGEAIPVSGDGNSTND